MSTLTGESGLFCLFASIPPDMQNCQAWNEQPLFNTRKCTASHGQTRPRTGSPSWAAVGTHLSARSACVDMSPSSRPTSINLQGFLLSFHGDLHSIDQEDSSLHSASQSYRIAQSNSLARLPAPRTLMQRTEHKLSKFSRLKEPSVGHNQRFIGSEAKDTID